MKLLDGIVMCDLDGCSSTDDIIKIEHFDDLDMDLCLWHIYLVPNMRKSIQDEKEKNNEHSKSKRH